MGFWWLRRLRSPLTRSDAAHQAIFEQWPTGAMVLNTATLQIVAANAVALRSLGYTLEEVRELRFGELFSAEGVDPRALVGKLLDATSRLPVEMRQRCKDGSQRNVEANCHPLTLGEQQLLGMAVHDVVVRMGGDEFVVILKGVQQTGQVSETAERINQALSAPMVVDGRTLVTTVSIGVALYPHDGLDMGELLRHSDTAMYQAKDRGRNNFQVFSPVMDRRLKERIAIETSLRTALQSQQLDVHYQPIVNIESNCVVALEALLRWKHPSHGYVRPERFMGIAEETGLMVPIGDFVLQRAVEDAVRWRQAGGTLVPIAVNVSAVQLQRSNLAESISRLTRQHGLEPSLLQVELTEGAVFERRDARNPDASQDAVASLRELGVRIAIDDFGVGYSSLSYLKRWRVDALKIDRSFVRDLVTDLSDLAIVSAIIAMARHLHIEVVAEGIEGWQQLEKLRQLGCGFAQGFLIARPAPAQDCAQYLSGKPVDLTQTLRTLEGLEATGSGDQFRVLQA